MLYISHVSLFDNISSSLVILHYITFVQYARIDCNISELAGEEALEIASFNTQQVFPLFGIVKCAWAWRTKFLYSAPIYCYSSIWFRPVSRIVTTYNIQPFTRGWTLLCQSNEFSAHQSPFQR